MARKTREIPLVREVRPEEGEECQECFGDGAAPFGKKGPLAVVRITSHSEEIDLCLKHALRLKHTMAVILARRSST
jgi:hypothetical protein